MAFEITGRLIEKFETRKVSDSFKKREFVLEKKPDNAGLSFSDYIKFQLTQDRCDLIEPYDINAELKVSFNIRGNKWEKEGRVNYFTNLDVWKIEEVEKSGDTPSDIPGPEEVPPLPEEIDDLPF